MPLTEFSDRFVVASGNRLRLKDHPTDWAKSDELKELSKDVIKEKAQAILATNIAELAEAQERLFANDCYSILVILQAMDAAGKDGTIKHVMSGVNPQGCQIYSFKKPSDEELDHDFLWRCAVRLPERGRIGIFNRSYYEDVLVVKVHPEILANSKLPPGKRGKSFWQDRYDSINDFERHLVRNGTKIVKFFLHVSKDEQRRRLLARLDTPAKNWKFSTADLQERSFFDEMIEAYEEAITATSTKWAAWHVIPADNKWVTRALVASILTQEINSLDLKFPEVDEPQRKLLAAAREQLENEK